MIKVSPSILSADLSRLGEEVSQIQLAGADYVHFDVMDGHFVSNISIGIPMLRSLRRATDMFLDVHLMIERPLRYVPQFCEAGADLLSFHVEADSERNIHEAINVAKLYGKKTGVSLKPATPAEAVLPYIKEVDLILVMTVEPGFSGQTFMEEQLEKLRAVSQYIEMYNSNCELEVDGGMNRRTAALAVACGANVLVSGDAVFGSKDRRTAIAELRGE